MAYCYLRPNQCAAELTCSRTCSQRASSSGLFYTGYGEGCLYGGGPVAWLEASSTGKEVCYPVARHLPCPMCVASLPAVPPFLLFPDTCSPVSVIDGLLAPPSPRLPERPPLFHVPRSSDDGRRRYVCK